MNTQSIRYLKGVGPKKETLFNRLGIRNTKDLLYYFPHRYEDRRDIIFIKDLKENDFSLVKGKIVARNLKPFKFRPFKRLGVKNTVFEVAISDGTSVASCVWFNQGYLNDYMKVGDNVFIYGKARRYKEKVQFLAPEYELIDSDDQDSLNVARIVGFYGLTRGLTQKTMRKAMYACWDGFGRGLPDPIPFYIRKEKGFPNITQCLKNIHFPPSLEEAQGARERFIFEELFFSQILVYLRKARQRFQEATAFKIALPLTHRLKQNIRFQLTASQETVIKEIFADLEKPHPMHRLLQGDVGCGKTIVAFFAIAAAVRNGLQAAFMVPTEVLVYQHVTTLQELFRGLNVTIKALSSSIIGERKEQIYRELEKGSIDVVVGTHSLIEERVRFKHLGLVVIDEQHKFGVAQRALLPRKGKGEVPHCLVMSATPIPRSLALSLYGDLDLSVITHLPPQRKEPHTMLIEEKKREWMYGFLQERLKEGRQVYIVYPVIEESRERDLKSLKEMHEVLREKFNRYTVGIFHGRMKANEKKDVVATFRANKINILISTTVIEVGINIENATTMVVENPERFGLAQLHQLRGRIRRSVYQPHFILISKPYISENARKRLEVIATITDGFVIAEQDLLLRGPGDFFGNVQSGYPQLKIANPLKDLQILKEARVAAYKVIKRDSSLQQAVHRSIRGYLDFWFKK